MFGVEAGVIAALDLADPVVDVDVRTDFATISGSLSWTIPSVRLFLQVYARAFGTTWPLTLLDLYVPARNGSAPISM